MTSTVPSLSRLPLDARSFLSSIHTFGEPSDFLRSAVADEDSQQFSESLQSLAQNVEVVAAGLRQSCSRQRAAPLLMDMLTELRAHRAFVVNLGLAWRGLYEYAAYLGALNNFRVLIGQWLLDHSPWDDDLKLTAEDFTLVAWRTLGEGTLLIDMYEQWLQGDQGEAGSGLDELQEPQLERVRQWWIRLRR